MRTTLVSWNLKGSGNPDTAAVAAYLREVGADVVGLQEVQWHQARRIARALGARSWGWGLKHWPIRTWPEGMAVVGVTRQVHVRTSALSSRWRLWSWRRRIVQVATVVGEDDDEGFTLVNVHLTPHGQAELRTTETTTVLAIVGNRTGPVVVSGDFNERPGGAIHHQLAAAGLRDGRGVSPGDEQAPGEGKRPPDLAPTNWKGWRRGTDELPTLRLDYVYVSPAISTSTVQVPEADAGDLARFAALSDHLPVTALLDIAGGDGAPDIADGDSGG
ncbi:MAG TPA: endonuclease/exonuclease/phosphatase family protein [Acidimicrobiales bacterium]|nr:endonuclease/exonuclease/phosphatase family protein [Acidimicrobiales bacterium]